VGDSGRCVFLVIKLQGVPILSWAYRKIQLLCRKLADKVAAGGYYVMVPDFLYGDPYNPENTEKPIKVWLQSHGTVCLLIDFFL